MAKVLPSAAHTQPIEAEIAPGIESITVNEITKLSHTKISRTANGLIQFDYQGNLQRLLDLKTVNAIYLLETFPVPRPKALLGHQHFHALLNLINQTLALHPSGSFQTLHIDAAGSDSSVMQRLQTELATQVNLKPTNDKGDLLIRLRPSLSHEGWDALVRLSPRPLATRAWRIQNFEGALNASVAHAMITLTSPTSSDTFLNLCSGSGTLLIERFMSGECQELIGIEIATEPLQITHANLHAAQIPQNRIRLLQADARRLPLTPQSINKLCVDLPFGQLSGSHAENMRLYPAILTEAARVAVPNALFAIITHEIRLMDTLIPQHTKYWQPEQVVKITLNGLHPRIYLLRRSDSI